MILIVKRDWFFFFFYEYGMMLLKFVFKNNIGFNLVVKKFFYFFGIKMWKNYSRFKKGNFCCLRVFILDI